MLLSACGREPAEAVLSPVGPVPAEAQRPGDPQAGYRALVNKPYVPCGIPYPAYEKFAARPAPHALLPGREGRNAQLPYFQTAYTTPGGVELVTANCLTCHAEYFNGRLIVGLGNASLDLTEDPLPGAESVGAYVQGEAQAGEWRKWAGRIAAMAPYMQAHTVGVNTADTLTLALFAHHDPQTLAWSEEPLLELPAIEPLPVSVPPWWRMGKKHALFYTAAGRGDHARFMMAASVMCVDDVDQAQAIDAWFPDIRAYIASLEPPPWPFAVDPALAGRGREVFERHCAGCHGAHGERETYPNLVIDLETIGTDPLLARLHATQDAYVHAFSRSFYGQIARWAPAMGYIAPPLDGVWATAPYLHNGSVPTIEALLDSRKRPAYWTRRFDSRDYDPRALGWNYTELAHGKAGIEDPQQRKRVYDTTLPGYANTGHTFGDSLTAAERAAVLEYLKTL
ncbi:MAG: c-type cytochrome [Pseudomonadota bacterium]|nr:c-type cytochrome [Pseudomonadota bacterium]